VSVWAIVVAAGGGERFGSAKQFLPLGASTVVEHAITTARASCDGVVVVLPADSPWDPPPGVLATTGSSTRAGSVRSGMQAVGDDATILVVHDAARPLATVDLFRSVIAAVRAGADGAVPGLPIADTVKRVTAATVVETLDRAALVGVQTPQAFRADVLRHAHATRADATDDAALVESIGGRVVVVPGEPTNFKVTHPDDLARAEASLAAEPARGA
jgi:2-C-methyl-D-erythritol 4-phosphate cytidylyltransferase